MQRYTKSNYLEQNTKRIMKIKRYKKFSLILFALLNIILLGFEIIAIRLPNEVRNYLMWTEFFNFSVSEIKNILLTTIGDINLLSTITFIYWGSHFIGLFLALTSLIYFTLRYLLFRNRFLLDLVDVHTLIIDITDYFEHSSKHNKLKLTRSVNSLNIYNRICPLKKHWYKYVNYQWFNQKDLMKAHRNILFTLSNFKRALKNSLDTGNPITDFLSPLVTLETFLLKTINKKENKLEIIDLDASSLFDTLVCFAKSSRPIILNALPERDKELSFYEKIKLLINNTLDSTLVKLALSISSIATVVMILGVVIFKLDIATSFLTWFSVLFGSIFISFTTEIIKQYGISKNEKLRE